MISKILPKQMYIIKTKKRVHIENIVNLLKNILKSYRLEDHNFIGIYIWFEFYNRYHLGFSKQVKKSITHPG